MAIYLRAPIGPAPSGHTPSGVHARRTPSGQHRRVPVRAYIAAPMTRSLPLHENLVLGEAPDDEPDDAEQLAG